MRVMVIVKATPDSEAGVMPSAELLEAMGRFNEQLMKAGVMLAGEGLRPTREGRRVRFEGAARSVRTGPFPNAPVQIAGFWIWQVKSLDEAVDWVKRCPNPHNDDCEVEIRPLFETEDFGDAMTHELRERETRHRELLARGSAKR